MLLRLLFLFKLNLGDISASRLPVTRNDNLGVHPIRPATHLKPQPDLATRRVSKVKHCSIVPVKCLPFSRLPHFNRSHVVYSVHIQKDHSKVTRVAASFLDIEHDVAGIGTWNPSVFNIHCTVFLKLFVSILITSQLCEGAWAHHEVCVVSVTLVCCHQVCSILIA
ncbi:hypothetical protein V8G54_001187 [Vigna mungo]|uniref:Secreted protein n=1 Tax=Vigna mungo TaxID=3915 RepID=A0AAQ3PA22_VIGMU